MSPVILNLRHIFVTLTVLVAIAFNQNVAAQVFDQFRLQGDHRGISTGFVTSFAYNTLDKQATVHFLDVAGNSDELTVALIPSGSIQTSLPVFLPPADFLQPEHHTWILTALNF